MYIYIFWLCLVFVAAQAFLQLQQVEVTLQLCPDFSQRWLLLWSIGSKACRLQQLWHVGSVVVTPRLQSTGSEVVVQRLSCSTACGILLDWGLNPCPLHWQSDPLPLTHQGSPTWKIIKQYRKKVKKIYIYYIQGLKASTVKMKISK